MKLTFAIVCTIFLIGCATTQKEPTAQEQVQGLQKMCETATPAMKARQEAKPLFERLGKREKITVLVDKLYTAHKTNKKIGRIFTHVAKEPFSKNVVDFLTIGTGGKAKYTGRNMKDAHAHLKITSADFMAAGGDITGVMKGMNYGENEIQEVVCALVSFVPVVVIDTI